MKRLYEKQPDGTFELASWLHESDFGDDRPASVGEDFLEGPTHTGTVTTPDGKQWPATIDAAGMAAIIDDDSE